MKSFRTRLWNRANYYKRQFKARKIYRRSFALLGVGIIVFAVVNETYFAQEDFNKYDISIIEGNILDDPVQQYDDKLVIDAATQDIVYNEGYQVGGESLGQNSAPKFSAVFEAGDKKSVEVTDVINQVGLKVTPKFKVGDPQKNKNRVIYPILGMKASKVYTLKGSALKEDLVLFKNQGNELEFEYELELAPGTEARVEGDGSIGVYGGASELLGSVSTSTDEDAALLEKARAQSPKTTLLFSIPAPFIVEANGNSTSNATTWFSLHDNGTTLRVHATNLDQANYPLSIDPSVYIETARKLMRGNNESNIDFNITNELIQKGSTTGGRFDSWDETLNLNEGRWNGGAAVAGGFIYYVGGASEGGIVKTVYSTPGTSTFTVPAGITSIGIKSWGGGGGGGGASADRIGGDGGGGGYSSSTVTVTPAEGISIRVGGGGTGGTGSSASNASGNGGGGGGYSGAFRGATALIVAAAGGGGGGANGDGGSTSRAPGSNAGAGGGTVGSDGDSNGNTGGGTGGTQVAGGTGGTVGGTNGASLTGGNGGNPGGGATTAGGTNGGGTGGGQQNGGGPNKRPGGGGAGAGYFGGGGGGGRNAQYNGGGGGAGGSSYATGSPTTIASGTGIAAANNSDADRASAGNGGAGGAIAGGSGNGGTNGIVIVTYATGGGGAVNDDVYWTQLDEVSGEISNANPGNGTCTNWCTNASYKLPVEIQGLSLTSYNGFLYALGGENDAGVRQSTVYISKLGANGEPSLWHPTDSNKANWVYWYSDTTLPAAVTYHTTAVYNNKMYLLGGKTNASPSGVNAVYAANINPTGTLSTWSTTGMTVLPSVRFGHDTHVYNDYIYVIGGNSSGTLQSSVQFTKLNEDGTMNGWQTTTPFSGARMSWGGTSTTIWGGYMYISGGCTSIDGSGYCTTVAGDVQLASINADGTLSNWGSIIGLNNLRIGHSFISWRNSIYGIGGCLSQNPANGQCVDLILTNDKGTINQDGDASTVSNSQASGSGSCTGADPYDCDIPPLGDGNGEGGQMAGGAIVNNGFIYYIGGCRTSGAGNLCSQGGGGRTASSTSYAAIATDGTLRRPTCTGTNKQYYGSWCVDNSNRINGGNGLAAFGFTVFNNTIYAIGGTTGAAWQSDVWRTSLAADGSLSAWSSQTYASVGLGSSSGYQYVFSRANPASAGTNPGNLYVIGGCNGTGTGVDCNNNIYTTVYKCNITTSATVGGCTTTGQLQIDSEPGTGGNQGLGVMAGTVYANYIYLIGGQSPNEAQRGQVMYAKIDNSNNIVAATGSIWTTSPQQLTPQRRRGVAFGYNGYLYALAGFATDTGLNDLLFAKIDVSNGSISAFSTSQVTVNPRWDLRAVVSSGYVYTLGGCSSGEPPAECLAMTSTVQTFQLYNNYSGSTTDFTTATNQTVNGSAGTTNRIGSSSMIANGYIYSAGGCVSATDCTTASTDVQRATVNADGSLGTWTATTAVLPAVRAWGQLEFVGGTLYYIGGQDSGGTAQTTVYYGTPVAGGDVTSWSTATNGLPAARSEISASVWNNRLYVSGGKNGATRFSTVYQSPSLSSGGNITSAWSSTTAFGTARAGHTSIAYAGNLYILGGHDGTNYLNDVQVAKINSDGTVGSWDYSTSLPQKVRNADGFAANGYMYLFGGRSADTTCTTNVYVSPISANTTITSGNNPTGLGGWFQTRTKLNGVARYGATAVYNQGKAYILGGGCGSTLTYATTDRVQYATLLSQPQQARYSRMIDTDSDVFPTKWLMNGLDNAIGARWNVKYQSSTNASNTWGNVTDFGTANLGDVEDYIPLDGTGTDTDFARYYYFNISIDSSQAYGYPDDVTRGPTIDDLTLFFTSDPNKRLKHGKTFTGGEKQPLDTPPPN